MRDLTILLGAGFSRNCGFPLAIDINEKFSSLDPDTLLYFMSGEWKWDEHSEADSSNGRLPYDRIGLSLLLHSYIEKYKTDSNKKFDYEEFLDWFIENSSNTDLLQNKINEVNSIIKETYNLPENDVSYLANSQERVYKNHLYDCYNELIADLLSRDYEIMYNQMDYFGFMVFFQMFNHKYIFTLNHDLLLEYLLRKFDKEFSDGFSSNNSPIVGERNQPLEIFTNEYVNDIKIYKLHGSIDYYRFDFYNQTKAIYLRTGEYLFFKPKSYHNKHFAKRIDLESGKVIQNQNINITPQFLTGKNKPVVIENSKFYSDLFKSFDNTLKMTTDLMTIGYSFGDLHINDMIIKAINSNVIKNVYNINRSKTNFFKIHGFKGNYFYYNNISNF